jgi:hypothetical protein
MLARETYEGPKVWHNREQFCRIAERDWLDGRDGLIWFIWVCLVHLVSLVQPNKPDRPNKQEKPAGSRSSRITVCGTGEPFQHPAMTTLSGPSGGSSLTAETFREYKKHVL